MLEHAADALWQWWAVDGGRWMVGGRRSAVDGGRLRGGWNVARGTWHMASAITSTSSLCPAARAVTRKSSTADAGASPALTTIVPTPPGAWVCAGGALRVWCGTVWYIVVRCATWCVGGDAWLLCLRIALVSQDGSVLCSWDVLRP